MSDSTGIIGIVVATLFFGLLAVLGYYFVAPPSQDRGIIQTMIVTTCVCMWMFYLCVYLSQVHPLVGPQLKIKENWLAPS